MNAVEKKKNLKEEDIHQKVGSGYRIYSFDDRGHHCMEFGSSLHG
jgi:hypothetical protein